MSKNAGTTRGDTGTTASGVHNPFRPGPTTSTCKVFATQQPATGSSSFGAPTLGASAIATGTTSSTTKMFGSTSLFGQPKPTTGFGPPACPSPTTATIGASAPAYTFTPTAEIPNTKPDVLLSNITAMSAYRGSSAEELRVQDYQQSRKTPSTTPQASFGGFAMSSAGAFGTPNMSQSAASPIFGGVSGAFASLKPPAASTTNAFGWPGSVSDPGKLQHIEDLLRKSLLGEEPVNTQFHLFSAKSPSGRVMEPRVLCANNVLLSKSSKYFLNLLSSDIHSSESSLVDVTGDNDIPDHVLIDDYGYESDSDLDDCDDGPAPVPDPKALRMTKPGAEARPKDDDLLSEEDTATSIKNPEHPNTEPSSGSNNGVRSAVGNDGESKNQVAMRLRSLGSRHILVKDTAFQTWYTLLNYLYTGKFGFTPLRSRTSGGRGPSTGSFDGPKCSGKSMYRLARKVGLDHLHLVAMQHIRGNLTAHNILQEISSSLLSKHPELLEMELDILYSHIASPPVIANFASLAKRIARNELAHGADIMVGIYTRLLKDRHPFALALASQSSFSALPAPPKPAVSEGNAPEAEADDRAGPSRVDELGAQSDSPSSGSGESLPSACTPTSANMPTLAAISSKEPDEGGKGKMTEERN